MSCSSILQRGFSHIGPSSRSLQLSRYASLLTELCSFFKSAETLADPFHVPSDCDLAHIIRAANLRNTEIVYKGKILRFLGKDDVERSFPTISPIPIVIFHVNIKCCIPIEPLEKLIVEVSGRSGAHTRVCAKTRNHIQDSQFAPIHVDVMQRSKPKLTALIFCTTSSVAEHDQFNPQWEDIYPCANNFIAYLSQFTQGPTLSTHYTKSAIGEFLRMEGVSNFGDLLEYILYEGLDQGAAERQSIKAKRCPTQLGRKVDPIPLSPALTRPLPPILELVQDPIPQVDSPLLEPDSPSPGSDIAITETKSATSTPVFSVGTSSPQSQSPFEEHHESVDLLSPSAVARQKDTCSDMSATIKKVKR